MKRIVYFFVIVILFFNFLLNAKVIKKIKAPDFYLYNTEGKVLHLYSEEFKNAVVVLNFFAQWCLPCKEEIPLLENLYKKYKKQKFVIIGIVIDTKISNFKLKNFINQYGISYPVLRADNDIIKKYGGISVVPTTFVLNHKKNVVDKIIGIINLKKLDEKIVKLIEIRKGIFTAVGSDK